MITITSIAGNIFHDKKFDSLKDNFERILVSRAELEKSRIRRKTDRGTDVGILLESGTTLHNGDVLHNDDKIIIVEQIPEKVISVGLKNNERSIELLVLIGHIIGNRHRPVAIENNTILFPIQADSELEVFQKLFADLADRIELSIQEKTFKSHTGANVHEHG